MRIHLIFALSALCLQNIIAQDSALHAPRITYSGFVDAYYSFDFSQPATIKRQTFLYNHNRHNEISINQAFLKASVEHTNYRGNIAIHGGTYAEDNYAAEPLLLRNIFEANAGISISKKNKLWLDAGIFPSHIGCESAVSSENMTLTRSLVAENSPYYLSGAKLSYATGKWELAAVICNGWQRIRRIQGNSLLSAGTQIKYSSNNFSVYWNTFAGTDDPDSTRRMRYYNDIFAQVSSGKLTLLAGLDVGLQQKVKGSSEYNSWFTPLLVLRYEVGKKISLSLRGEYFEDRNQVIIITRTKNGFIVSGTSINADYKPASNILLRLEGRWLNSKDQIFHTGSIITRDNFFTTASVAVSI